MPIKKIVKKVKVEVEPEAPIVEAVVEPTIEEKIAENAVDLAEVDALLGEEVGVTVEPKVDYQVVDINGKKYRKYLRADGTTDLELII